MVIDFKFRYSTKLLLLTKQPVDYNKINVKTSFKKHTKYHHGNGKSVHNGNLTV